MIPSNKSIKIAATAIVLINVAVSLLMLCSEWFSDNNWKFTDCIESVNWAIVYCAMLGTYVKGKKDWYFTLIFAAFGSLVIYGIYDAVYCATVYFEYDSYTKANEVLNGSYTLVNWCYLTTLWAVFLFVFFCIIMPRLPFWLNE